MTLISSKNATSGNSASSNSALNHPASNRARNFDLIVFDWDGTVMDSTAVIVSCIQESARDLGLPVPAKSIANYVIGRTRLSPIIVRYSWTGTKAPGTDTATVRVEYTYTPIVRVIASSPNSPLAAIAFSGPQKKSPLPAAMRI